MAELKTKMNDQSVEGFLQAVPDEQKRKDSFALLEMMKKATHIDPKMWGESIVGFGAMHYKGASGREGDWPPVAFSPRKQNLSVYMMDGFEKYSDLLGRLGKHKTGKGCLYIKRLAEVDLDVLQQMIERSYQSQSTTVSA